MISDHQAKRERRKENGEKKKIAVCDTFCINDRQVRSQHCLYQQVQRVNKIPVKKLLRLFHRVQRLELRQQVNLLQQRQLKLSLQTNPATAATPEAAGVVYEDQKIKITNAKADKVTIVISKYYDNKTLAGVELKENVTLENGSGEVAYDLQGKAAKIMVWDDIKTMTPLFATTSVEGTVDPAPTLKPTAPTSQPETTPTAEPTATPTVKPTIDPSAIYYKLDFEDSSKHI